MLSPGGAGASSIHCIAAEYHLLEAGETTMAMQDAFLGNIAIGTAWPGAGAGAGVRFDIDRRQPSAYNRPP